MKFSKPTTFLGRNGMFAATGLEINPYLTADNHSVVVLEPVTSRGVIGRCNIEIPVEDIPSLIAELQALDPHCKKCGCHLVNGKCEDEACPYSDHPQTTNLDSLYEPKTS